MNWRPYVTMIAMVAISGCGTRPKTYQPPDATKMNVARQKLSADVDRATVSARKAQGHVRDAQTSAGKVTKFSGTIEVKLGQLHGRVTQELRPVVEDIQKDVAAEKEEQTVLTGVLNDAITIQKTLEGELNQAQSDKTQLSKESEAYAAEAMRLAQMATDENTARIAAEKSLSWYRWHSWAVKIAATLGVIAIIAVAFLWFTGRLAGLFSKVV